MGGLIIPREKSTIGVGCNIKGITNIGILALKVSKSYLFSFLTSFICLKIFMAYAKANSKYV